MKRRRRHRRRRRLLLTFTVVVAGVIAACAPFGSPDPDTEVKPTPNTPNKDASAVEGSFGDGAGGNGDGSADANGVKESSATDATFAAKYRDLVLSDDPIAYWRFNENGGVGTVVQSLIGGTTANAVIVNNVMQNVGGIFVEDTAFDFGATGAVVETPSTQFEFTGTANFSLEAWFRPRSFDTDHRHLFMKDTQLGGTPVNREAYGVYLRSPEGLVFERWAQNTPVKVGVSFTQGMLLQWHHVVATYDGVGLILYLDGVPTGPIADPRQMGAKTHPFRIGAKHPNPPFGELNATIDEVAVYDHALKAPRVVAHFAAGNKL